MENSQLDVDDMHSKANKAAEVLKAMSNESRLLILCHLGQGEISVNELNKHIDLSQSSLSQHLARLRKDGLVTTRRESQTIYYSIADDIALEIISLLQAKFCGISTS